MYQTYKQPSKILNESWKYHMWKILEYFTEITDCYVYYNNSNIICFYMKLLSSLNISVLESLVINQSMSMCYNLHFLAGCLLPKSYGLWQRFYKIIVNWYFNKLYNIIGYLYTNL